MKINWKVRLKHKPFLASLFAFLLLLIQQVTAAFGYSLPEAVGEQATAIFNTILSILILLGIVIDPTTSEVSDSVQALKYKKPKDDAK
ncbi:MULTISPECIES: phage holin [Lysinibacillus]|uniref:phage holin n=1 Tax=Lysinibacillus TaxID=400634 RepID=UPI0021759FAA|nr:phage holin [Lysinibacillus sp. A4]MCS5501255.1 phage holin [Lysinibacillus sp. A4]